MLISLVNFVSNMKISNWIEKFLRETNVPRHIYDPHYHRPIYATFSDLSRWKKERKKIGINSSFPINQTKSSPLPVYQHQTYDGLLLEGRICDVVRLPNTRISQRVIKVSKLREDSKQRGALNLVFENAIRKKQKGHN